MRYTIKSGDTLWALARKHGVTVDDLLRLNPHITDRNKIYAGRILNLPESPVVLRDRELGADLAKSGLVRPPLFPEAMANPKQPNPVEQDAIDSRRGMDAGLMDPTQLALLGGAVAANAVVKAIPAIAKAMPAALPAAGQVAPTASNVQALQGSRGAAAAMLQSTDAQIANKTLPEMIQWYMQQKAPQLTNWGF